MTTNPISTPVLPCAVVGNPDLRATPATGIGANLTPKDRARTLGCSRSEQSSVCNKYHVVGIGRCDVIRQIMVRAATQAELAAAICEARITEVYYISELGPTIPRKGNNSIPERNRQWVEVEPEGVS